MHPSSPPPRNVDSTLARILRFVIKGYCYSPSRFLSSSRGKRNFRWLEKEIPRFFSLFFSLTDCSFHSITIKLPYRETFPELKKRFSFPERERERFVSQIKWPIVDTKDWNNYESSISLLLLPPRSHSWLDFDALCKSHRSHVAENWRKKKKKSFSLPMH